MINYGYGMLWLPNWLANWFTGNYTKKTSKPHENLVIFHSTCYGHGHEWLSQQWRSQAANVWGHLKTTRWHGVDWAKPLKSLGLWQLFFQIDWHVDALCVVVYSSNISCTKKLGTRGLRLPILFVVLPYHSWHWLVTWPCVNVGPGIQNITYHKTYTKNCDF